MAIATPSDRVNDNGYDDRSGLASEEWEAFQMFQTVVDRTYCVDDNHLYAVGYETGADSANMWGCYFAGDGQFPASTPDQPRKFAPGYHLRGEGVVSGLDPDDMIPGATDPRRSSGSTTRRMCPSRSRSASPRAIGPCE